MPERSDAGSTEPGPETGRTVKVQLLAVPGCPLVGDLREVLRRSVAAAPFPVEIVELVGDFPSPTVLVDGDDVTGRLAGEGASCRLDVPSQAQIASALDAAGRSDPPAP